MYTYKAKCLRVVDGDTLDAQIDLGFDTHKVIRIRLVGINTPESRTRDLEEKARGLAAKQFVVDALPLPKDIKEYKQKTMKRSHSSESLKLKVKYDDII